MTLSSLFSRWPKNRILVVGDFMLDTYTIGHVQRVSPEAPVIVVNAKKINKLPGGAGNVALNLVSLGARVSVLGRLGEDTPKVELLENLRNEKIETEALYIQEDYQTPIKNRIMAGSQQIVRIDFEKKDPLPKFLEDRIIADFPKIFKGVSIIAISDYDKGFLTARLLQALIQKAREYQIPVLIDPKGKDFSKYRGATLIKPNLKEAILASGFEEETDLKMVAEAIQKQTQIPHVMITKSSSGISLFSENTSKDYPVKAKEVTDVTGAGDTVLAVLTYALSNKVTLDEAILLCNLAAGEVIEHLGCARVSIKTLAELILNQHLDHKVFSEKYLSILQFILDHEDFVLLKIASGNMFSPSLLTQLKKIKGEHLHCKMVVYFEEEPEDPALIELLASLIEVDFIIKKVKNLQKFCQKHGPKKTYDFVDDSFELKESLSIRS